MKQTHKAGRVAPIVQSAAVPDPLKDTPAALSELDNAVSYLDSALGSLIGSLAPVLHGYDLPPCAPVQESQCELSSQIRDLRDRVATMSTQVERATQALEI